MLDNEVLLAFLGEKDFFLAALLDEKRRGFSFGTTMSSTWKRVEDFFWSIHGLCEVQPALQPQTPKENLDDMEQWSLPILRALAL